LDEQSADGGNAIAVSKLGILSTALCRCSVIPAMRSTLWKLGLLLTATLTTLGVPKFVTAQTALPMHLYFAEGYMELTVPNTQTTVAASGRLRVYDLHLAKMFEVTHALCQQETIAPGITWLYRAGGGSIEMGDFEISCRLAGEVASAYGLGQAEPTLITRFSGEGYGDRTEQWQIPTLNIVGGKVDRWLAFTQRFRPLP